MSELVTAARPYARAVFEHAQAGKDFTQWNDSLAFLSVAVLDEGIQSLIESPKFSADQIGEMLIKIGEGHVHNEAKNLIKLLAENDRLKLLPQITLLYERLRDEAEGSIEAQVVSAYEMDEKQQKAIATSLKKRLGREVKLAVEIDESLLGGAIIRAGDLVIDGSIRSRIEKLSGALTR